MSDSQNMDWPVFFKDTLKLGNPQSPVGICTLWTRKEDVYSTVPADSYAVCGNLYTVQGINAMVKNILANPRIRSVIICGNDLMKTGDALINFVEKGVCDDRRIAGSSGFIDSNIDSALVELVRKNIEVIDMRGREADVPKKTKELSANKSKPFVKPTIVSGETDDAAQLTSDEVAFRVSGKSVADAWLKVLDTVLKFGEVKKTDYGIRQKEIIDMVTVIDGDDEGIAPWMNFTAADLENYYKTFFGSGAERGIEYTYGERLFSYALDNVPDKFLGEMRATTDQVKTIVEKLKKDPHTRRAVAFVLRDKDAGSKNPPCLTQITWNVKGGRLLQTAVFRSNDMFGAWPLNAFALRRLQKSIASELGVPAGQMITIANSAHVYENSWDAAADIVRKNYAGMPVQFEPDKNGYFVVSVDADAGEVVVEHRLNDGRPSGYVFRGKESQELYRRVMNENLITKFDHAAYVGQEIAKAEAALHENKKYVQDRA
ncbi:MAG: thymidylate synthase [Candidatus Aenigmarchaeota archaeon]|nr:thymidylate synthase [Candidatus Aenigmarchaeota archaeon]